MCAHWIANTKGMHIALDKDLLSPGLRTNVLLETDGFYATFLLHYKSNQKLVNKHYLSRSRFAKMILLSAMLYTRSAFCFLGWLLKTNRSYVNKPA